MQKSYETSLPEGYQEVLTMDYGSKKLGLQLNLAAMVISLAVILPAVLWIQPQILRDYRLSSALVFLAVLLGYVLLHELTHGAVYKLLTHQKLTFGLTLSVAFCGVPDIYVYRRTALIATLAPFVVFLPVFVIPLLRLTNTVDQLFCAIALGLHIGGCAGDLWNSWLLFTRFRNPAALMNDTGPKQTFYLPAGNP